MPPKKKKSTPVVVGTVSTRSTRRESIVNIEIIPKANKSATRVPTPKKSSKQLPKTPVKQDTEERKVTECKKTSPEILEILKDWSDDENSQDNSLLSISSGARNLVTDKSDNNSSSLPVDQQSLIDILEGNHPEHQSKPIKETLEHKHNQAILKKPKKFPLIKDLVENPIVNVDSPQIEESEIIEECVVEDNSIIIELPEEQMEVIAQDCADKDRNKELNVSLEDISILDKKLRNPVVAYRPESRIQKNAGDWASDNAEEGHGSPVENIEIIQNTYITHKNQNQFDRTQEDKEDKQQKDLSSLVQEIKRSAGSSDENSKLPSSCRIDEENHSMTSEDTTSQSMITVQDEDALDVDIQMSDNSTNNYELVEEQVVLDTSEPMIIEHLENVHSAVQIQRHNLLENDENLPERSEIITCYNETLGVTRKSSNNDELSLNLRENPHKSILQEVSSVAAEVPAEVELKVNEPSDQGVSNDNLLKNHQNRGYGNFTLDIQKGLKEGIIRSHSESAKPLISSVQQNIVQLDNVLVENCDGNSSAISMEPVKVISNADIRADQGDSVKNPSSVQIGVPVKKINIPNEKSVWEKEKKENIQITNLELNELFRNKTQDQCLNPLEKELQEAPDSVYAQSEEISLCQKINELMDISKESSKIKEIDPAADKLQKGIQNMHIRDKNDKAGLKTEITGNKNFQNKESRSLFESSGNTEQETEQERLQLTSVEEKSKDNILTLKSPLVSPQTKGGKLFVDSDTEKSLKSCYDKKDIIDIDNKQRRRSARRKLTGDEAQPSDIAKQEKLTNLQLPDKATLDFEVNSSFECGLQEELPSKHLRVRGKKVQRKEDTEYCTAHNDLKIISDAELDLNKDVKSPKNLKGKSKKTLEKYTLDVIKMDIDSESSETKTSEAEGDSTSNESSQSSSSTKIYKTRLKNVLVKQVEELDKLDVEANVKSIQTEINKSELDSDENSQSKKLKGTKLKKSLDKPQNETDIKILQANIDATIDEVLRKYTHCEPSTPEECTSPKELKSKVIKPVKESKKKKEFKLKKDEKYELSEEVRRSDRIKTILPVKKKSHGLVRSKSEPTLSVEAENSDTNSVLSELEKPTPLSPQLNKKYKAKSRAKSSENLQIPNSGALLSENSPQLPKALDLKADKSGQAEIEARLKSFVHLKENQYKTDRQICKEAREMVCDCYLAEEDIEKDEYGCGEDCLNRLLMIECGYLCQIGDRCTNKRFQKGQVAPVEVFKTEKKGLGLIAAANIPYGEFILEYIGEVLNPEEFDKRAEVYSKDQNIHFYFMSLRADAIIDATMKGNISRFINHSCDPNAETQKWTVNGELRIGFFSTRTILAGEEITFDYKFQRYGKEAQKCYCEAAICRGWLGERPDDSEDEDEEEEEETPKAEQVEIAKVEVKLSTPDILGTQETSEDFIQEKTVEKMEIDIKAEVTEEKVPEETAATAQVQQTLKKTNKKKPRKELLYEDFDQLNEDIEMVVTTGLKNQAHTLKLSRLMVRAKDLDQRKKLLRVLRRGELPCRRLFLDYHGLRLMHGYMIDAQQLTNSEKKSNYSQLEFLQTKLELLQTLAVLPIQNKTMLIESKVLPAVEKWAKNEDLVEDSIDQKDGKKSPEERNKQEDSLDPVVNEKIDEIKFLASKLLEEWVNLKESFRIPKKQRIEQMKEHEKEANRKFVESSYGQEKESSRKNDQRYRTWSRYKSERETNKKGHRTEDKPSAEYLKISKHERRKLFALQMELKEEERRLKQREMWRQHEMNCMMIGADPRFTAPFDPSKGFQYIWNPSIGQWQALPVPSAQNQGVFNSPVTTQGVTGFNVPPTSQGVSSYNVPPTHKPNLLGHYPQAMLNVSGMPGSAQQYPGMQPNIAPMVPGLSTSVPAITSSVPGMASSLPGITGLVPGMTGSLHGISGSTPVIAGAVSGITQPPLPALPMYQEVKQVEEDPAQVKFAGPIPPPVKLPPKWKCAKDKYGRPYYYHVKLRKSQWEPPPLPEEVDESSDTSSSETSSLSSSDTSSDSDTDDEIDDTKLLMEVRKQMENTSKFALKSVIPRHVKKEEKDSATPSPEIKQESDNEDEPTEELKETEEENPEQLSSIDIRLKEQFNLDSGGPSKKKRRIGLCQEIIISPRTEEDRQQFKEDLKRYKATKEKLKRQKEQMVHQAKKKLKTSSSLDDTKRSKRLLKNTAKSRMRQMNEWNDEHAKKIKEVFRSTMATTVVGVLNAYRKPDCKESRITNTEDFKHLARKLTHFVMLKEMKHINTIEELICTDNVKAKAREYIKKYMSKFGEVYQKRQDEPDFKD